jgi:hypothetical protein
MTEKKLPNGMKLIFAPGAFDNFEGTQEELDALIKEIEQGFEDGTFFEKATPVDFEDGTWEEEDIEHITQTLSNVSDGNRTLQ